MPSTDATPARSALHFSWCSHERQSRRPRVLLRDFIFEAMDPVERDSAAARLCLVNDDDVGAHYHLKRVVECVRAAAATFKELEALLGERKAA
jgi:hypothetical protein